MVPLAVVTQGPQPCPLQLLLTVGATQCKAAAAKGILTTRAHNAKSTLNTLAQRTCAADLMQARIHTKLQRCTTLMTLPKPPPDMYR